MHPKCTLFVSASFLFIVTATSCRVYHTHGTSTSAPPQENRVVVVREQPRVIVVREQPQVVVNQPTNNNVDLARKLETERLERERLEKERLEKERIEKEKKDKEERFKQIEARKEQMAKDKKESLAIL